jgi:hypothetical protein
VPSCSRPPSVGFYIELNPRSVTFDPTTASVSADLELPAEAVARLVYGRLDAERSGHIFR